MLSKVTNETVLCVPVPGLLKVRMSVGIAASRLKAAEVQPIPDAPDEILAD
jgi:hypothetical protein